MNRGTTSQGLLVCWLGLVVLQIARGTGGGESGFHWPQPRLIVAPAVIYTGLSLLALASSPLAVAFGVGIDVAVAINPGVMTKTDATLTRVIGVSKTSSTSGAPTNPLTSPAPANPLVVGSGGGHGVLMS